jgi:hypothetical protein
MIGDFYSVIFTDHDYIEDYHLQEIIRSCSTYKTVYSEPYNNNTITVIQVR